MACGDAHAAGIRLQDLNRDLEKPIRQLAVEAGHGFADENAEGNSGP